MPGSFATHAGNGVPNIAKTMPAVRSFATDSTPFFEYPFAITGVTKDSAGAVLANCVVVAFRTSDDSVAARGTSDASGNYRLDASPAIAHYVVAYKAGAPDVTGATVNTVVGA